MNRKNRYMQNKYMKNGYILILTAMISGLLLLFGISYLSFFTQERDITQHGEQDIIAEAAANAGFAEGVFQLEKDMGWNQGVSNAVLTASGATYAITFDTTKSFYSTNNSGGAVTITGYGGRQVPKGMVHLISVGSFANNRQIEEALIGESPFQSGLFVEDSITMNGSVVVDSIASSISGGNIGTNSSSNATVTLNGNITVQGIITVGPGGSQSVIESRGGSSYQGYSVASKEQGLPVIEGSDGVSSGDVALSGGTRTLAPGTYGRLDISSGATLILNPGTYIFTGDIDSQGGIIRLASDDQVKIFAEGDISFNGTNLINTITSGGSTPSASNLLIFGGNNTDSVNFSGNFTGYFGLYAPLADISISGRGDLYGSIIGKTITINGVAPGGRGSVTSTTGLGIHYDSSLSLTVTLPIVVTRW